MMLERKGQRFDFFSGTNIQKDRVVLLQEFFFPEQCFF